MRPLASERTQMAERFARHERRRSSRSLLAFFVVCSCGRMSVPGGLELERTDDTGRALLAPSSSMEVIRYTVKVGRSSVTRVPSASQSASSCWAIA